MKRIPRFGRRRGMTITEMLITAAITAGIVMTMVGSNRLQTIVWQNGATSFASQRDGQLSVQRMAATIRAARQVVVASSTASRLTLQMPAYDAGGNLIVPQQNGQLIAFYTSNATGNPDASGRILWRTVNGVPDSAWSLVGGRGRTVLASGGLEFVYYPPDDPETVTIRVKAASSVGQKTTEFETGQEILLRNKGL
jgi:hypothetical protein